MYIFFFFLESPHVDKHEIINVQMRPLIKCLGRTACRQTGPRWGVRRKLQDTRTCPSGKTNQGEPHFARTVVADDLPPQALTGSIQ